MKLEDTIKHKLFRVSISSYSRNRAHDFIIECKAEFSKPFPICVPITNVLRSDLIYKKLYLDGYGCQERSTPRALYNLLFSNWLSNHVLVKLKLKDTYYYYAPGVLFTEDKIPLFWFGYELDRSNPNPMAVKPRLFISTLLLSNANVSGKPMEKFFMSTIVPYLVNNPVYCNGYQGYTTIEIDNHMDNTFFTPSGELVTSTPVDKINDRLNDILADNVDVIAAFTDNYVGNV